MNSKYEGNQDGEHAGGFFHVRFSDMPARGRFWAGITMDLDARRVRRQAEG